jgi:hypothetical protein
MVYGAASDDETERAVVLVFDPEGKGRRIYASGIRNCVAMAVNSATSSTSRPPERSASPSCCRYWRRRGNRMNRREFITLLDKRS